MSAEFCKGQKQGWSGCRGVDWWLQICSALRAKCCSWIPSHGQYLSPSLCSIFVILSINPMKRSKPTMSQTISQFFLTTLPCLWHSAPSPFVPAEYHFSKRRSTCLKQVYTVVFSKCYLNQSKWCICWGLFSAAD